MAKEYAGIPGAALQPIDYSQQTSKVINPLVAAHEKRKAQKAELDQVYQQADTEVRQTEQFQNQTLNTLVTNGVDVVRNSMSEWNKALKRGEISPSEYRAKYNNAQQDWSMFANQAKSYDSTMANFLQRQQPGEDGKIAGSGFEQYMSGVFAGNADLQGASLAATNDGKILFNKTDASGNIVSSTGVSRMSNPGNMIDNRFDLSGSISAETDLWDDYKISTGSGWQGFTNIQDVRQNPAYQYAVDAKVQAVLSNNRSTASVLVDNGIGEYDYYQTPEDLRQAVIGQVESAKRVAEATGTTLSDQQISEIAKAKQEKMIRVEYDRIGVMQPVISPEQAKAAKERVVAEIEIQLGHDETKSPGWKPTPSGGGGDDDDGQGTYASYAAFRNAWTSGSESAMNAMNSNFTFTETDNGVWSISQDKPVIDKWTQLPKIGPDGKPLMTTKPVATGISNPRDMAPYIFKTGTKRGDTAHERYDREKEAFIEAEGSREQKSAAPKKGTVRNGYKFLGGNPSDKSNWKKV